MSENNTILELCHLQKQFGEHVVLKDIQSKHADTYPYTLNIDSK